jgi:predicted CoA-substrate-specific enzyme activase
MIVAGVDSGSRALKLVLWETGNNGEAGGRILAAAVRDQGVHHHALAAATFDDLLGQAALPRDKVSHVIATGYGRNLIRFADATITEITCHAAGVRQLVPGVRTIVEIGGQDTKVIRLDCTGAVSDFAMNDRCAAGTGRFLEVVATRLEATLEDLADLAIRAACPAAISSTCVLFAESEIIGLLASGVGRENIVAGVQRALASRLAAMAGTLEEPIVFTGGVALLPGMRVALEESLRRPVLAAPSPQITGALGAAILAARRCTA